MSEIQLRSHQWFGRHDLMGFTNRSWMKNQGHAEHLVDGRPVIGICNTWSELIPCNGHFRILVEQVKKASSDCWHWKQAGTVQRPRHPQVVRMQALGRAALRLGRRTQRGAADSREAADAESEAAPSEELKGVISIKGGRATIGVQQPSSDPHIEIFDDADLPALAQRVAAVTDRVRARWEEAPKKSPPTCAPAPSPEPAATLVGGGSGASASDPAAVLEVQSERGFWGGHCVRLSAVDGVPATGRDRSCGSGQEPGCARSGPAGSAHGCRARIGAVCGCPAPLRQGPGPRCG